jgi:adenylate cyclase
MKRKPKLKRLLDRQEISALLTGYVPLLGPGVSLSLVDARGRRLWGKVDLDETEQAQMWNTVRHQKAFVAPTKDAAAWAITVAGEALGMLLFSGKLPTNLDVSAPVLVLTLEMLAAKSADKRAIAQETLDRYREINVLYNIGETLGACLELEEVCRLVLDESMKLTNSRYGAVLLVDPEKTGPPSTLADLTLEAVIGPDRPSSTILDQSLSIAVQVVREGKPQIVNDFRPNGLDPMPLVCAPLRFREDTLGAILLLEKADQGEFTAADGKLLLALAAQAASAIKNARMFEDIRKQRDEIATMKNYMDNIFASIASGVITTDMNGIITTFNRAAEAILSLPSRTVHNRPYQKALAFLNNTPLPKMMNDVQESDRTYIDYEISSHLPTRGQVHLNMSLSQLRGSSQEPLGVTIVVDDVTEKKRFERERSMVRRYLPPELVDSLPDNLEELKLRGQRQMMTTLFADIRGFTSFSEKHSPETVVEVINGYFALADQAVRQHHGIIDKYLGDAVMAVFNTPLLETQDHAWDAVCAAWELKQAINRYHAEVEPKLRLNFGIGICTGEAVVGNVGAIHHIEYTAIGDAVNVAKRLQENATAGQIVISRSTWERVQDCVRATSLPSVTLKGRHTATEVFELVELVSG